MVIQALLLKAGNVIFTLIINANSKDSLFDKQWNFRILLPVILS